MGTDIHPYAEVLWGGQWTRADAKMPSGRNYRAFGVLAGVRNGVGFAGCDMGDPIAPISEPRGIPRDTSIIESDDGEYTDWTWLGDHSHSWVTLAELLAVDLDASATLRGMVSPDAAAQFRATGEAPQSWCGWTSQADWEQIQWGVPLRAAAPLLTELINAMTPLGNPEDVRLVFGFDS